MPDPIQVMHIMFAVKDNPYCPIHELANFMQTYGKTKEIKEIGGNPKVIKEGLRTLVSKGICTTSRDRDPVVDTWKRPKDLLIKFDAKKEQPFELSCNGTEEIKCNIRLWTKHFSPQKKTNTKRPLTELELWSKLRESYTTVDRTIFDKYKPNTTQIITEEVEDDIIVSEVKKEVKT